MKEYRFFFKEDLGGGDVREITRTEWLKDSVDPRKYGHELAKDIIYGRKQSFKMFGQKRKFYDCQYISHKMINDDFEQAKKDYFKEREQRENSAAKKLEKEVEKMVEFDFYQITGKWNAAKVTRRADKLEEAERAADELERGGASNVEIIGVKAGKREKIRGQIKPAKPAKKKSPAKTRERKKTPAKRAKTAVKTKGITGEYYITDFTTEKKAKAAAENIRALGFETEIVEPRGQLDLFTSDENKNKSFLFSPRELEAIFSALSSYGAGGLSSVSYKELLNCFERAALRGGDIQITLNGRERVLIYSALQKRLKDERDPMHNTFFNLVRDLNE